MSKMRRTKRMVKKPMQRKLEKDGARNESNELMRGEGKVERKGKDRQNRSEEEKTRQEKRREERTETATRKRRHEKEDRTIRVRNRDSLGFLRAPLHPTAPPSTQPWTTPNNQIKSNQIKSNQIEHQRKGDERGDKRVQRRKKQREKAGLFVLTSRSFSECVSVAACRAASCRVPPPSWKLFFRSFRFLLPAIPSFPESRRWKERNPTNE